VVGFYICGESFSKDLVDDDISDTIGLSRPDLDIFYLVDYDGQDNTEFFKGKNYSRDQIGIDSIMPYDSTELNMGTELVLSGFVKIIISQLATYHCLVIWGHGKGAEGICFDRSSKLDGNAIERSAKNRCLDLIIFDACEMMSIEFLVSISESSRYVMGSEKDIPDRGLDYFRGFTKYTHSKDKTMLSLAHAIMDETRNFYSREPSRFSLQLSVVSMSDLDKLSAELLSGRSIRCSTLPPTFESEKRTDLGLLLALNGHGSILPFFNNTVKYQVLLRSSSRLDVQDLTGLSILSPALADAWAKDPFLSRLITPENQTRA